MTTDEKIRALVEMDVPREAKLKGGRIRQLRPLPGGQPWGIFFVEFENAKLPVVVLRRILSNLVMKKRAKSGEAKRWALSDLLFVSAFGQSSNREIAFAHFHKDPETTELPILRVLGWDGGDTPLKIEHVAGVLKSRLKWPDDPKDQDAWRAQWTKAFRHRMGHVISTANDLAEALAHFARKIRDAAVTIMAHESEAKGQLRQLHAAFRSALIHDLSEADFADTYAQTVTYGLLTAAISKTEMSEGRHGTALSAEDMTAMVPVTNPFLKEMLESFLQAGGRKGGMDFDELGINEVVELLRGDETDLPAILRDFGNRTRGEDPVIHFYEHFLGAYNKKLKIQRGVFYTPQPVVSYIVRSVHELLQTEFGLEDGLADTTTWGEMLKKHSGLKLPTTFDDKNKEHPISPDEPFVQILDPATGTATFLVEVIDVIYKHLEAKWKKGGGAAMPRHSSFIIHPSSFAAFWNDYVPKALLPRLHAFELMMAPYAIAHMKIGLKLAETGYRFGTEERARIYLTNALEPWVTQLPLIGFDALAHEAEAVNEIKRHKRFTVVIGNPPYSKSSQNQGQWIDGIMEEYKRTVRAAETQIQALSDDYSKFLRFAHFTLEQSRVGVLGFITNNGYLDGPLFRDMRSSMLAFFEGIRIVNLHGDSRKRFAPPEGRADENVFDIQQGVATSIFWRNEKPQTDGNLGYSEIWGDRRERYDSLRSRSAIQDKSERLKPTPPFFLFIPVSKELEAEFHVGWHLYQVFGTGNGEVDNHESYGAGFVTQQDKFAIGFSPDDIAENVREFLDPNSREKVLWDRFEFCSTNQWSFDRAKRELKGLNIRRLTKRCLYRPFDYRFTAFDRNICTILRKRITSQFDKDNLGLLTTRRVTRLPYNNVFVTNQYAEYKVASHDRNTIVFPLWIQVDEDGKGGGLFGDKRRLNLNPALLQTIALRLSLPQEGEHGLPHGMTPEDIFGYAYAVLHSPRYRSRYAEFLKIDFPRLPLTGNLELFRALARLGGELTTLHLLESPKLAQPVTGFIGGRDPEVQKPSWSHDTVWIDKKQTIGFKGVPENVWNFHIGGYQVCQKWLKDRKGRMLTEDDIAHYHKIVIALTETIRLMAEIDDVIETHGGWPDAFTTQTKETTA